MMNTMSIDGYRAIIQYDPDIEMFRGEFVGINGGADFYASDVAGLRREAVKSLQVFLDMCREDGVEPLRQFSGKFNLRLSPELHEQIAAASAAVGKSINQWVANELSASVKDRQTSVRGHTALNKRTPTEKDHVGGYRRE